MSFRASAERSLRKFKEVKAVLRRKGDASNQATTRSNTPTNTTPQVLSGSSNVTSLMRKGLKELIRVVGPVTDLVGPIKGLVEVLEASINMYEMTGQYEKEYSELCIQLEATIDNLNRYFGDGGLMTMTTSMETICTSIKLELDNIQSRMVRKPGVRYLAARGDVDAILGCYRRIDLDLRRLSLNANWETLKNIKIQAASARVDRLSPSLSARYNSAEAEDELKRQECTPGTRVRVLKEILDWSHSGGHGTIYWLNGMAGTGKTTIAYSLCKQLNAEHKLAASFFCSRLREECRMVKRIIPSIAYQLARFSLPFLSVLSAVLEKDLDLHSSSLHIQFEELIAKPLQKTKDTLPEGLVVVIDALDECENKESTGKILDLLLNKAANLPIKFLISSRPESEIRDRMTEEQVESRLVLHELGRDEVRLDIEKYLREGLAKMNPSEDDITELAKRSGVLFIYAATAVRYIGYDNFRSDPRGRLRVITHGPQSQGDGETKDIDELYKRIIETAFNDEGRRKVERDNTERVLHTVLCAREPLTVAGLSGLLEINSVDEVQTALRPLWSVLHVAGASGLAAVTTLHASFPDFMFSSARSKSYHCDPEAHNQKLAELCFECIERLRPQFNICELESSYLPDEKAPNLKERVESAIPPELLYACQYWADHVEAGKGVSTVVKQLQEFLSTKLLLWMEVLSLKKQMRFGIECMRLTVKWVNQFEGHPELTELARDASRFVEAFASNPVSQSTPHIYVSMLAFWPRSAPIVKHYARFTRGPVTAEGTGLDRRQLAHLSTWAFEEGIGAMSVSADGSYIGLGIGNDVLVVDSWSGRKVLGPLKVNEKMVESIAFSPDGTHLFSCSHTFWPKHATILGWDTHTGDTVLGPLRVDGHTNRINCLTFSPDGTRIATGSNGETIRLWDTENGTMLHCLAVQGGSYAVVFSPDGTRVASTSDKTLYVWDSQTGDIILGPLTHTEDIDTIAFSPDNSRIIGSTHSDDAYNIHMWDAQTGDTIFGPIQAHRNYIRCIRYSPDSRYIVSGSADRTISVWDAHNGNLVLGPLEAHTGTVSSVTFSPDSSRIISACHRGLVCTWDAQQRSLTRGSINAGSDHIRCVKFSSDGTRFVSGSEQGTISIWDAQTGETKVGPIKAHTDPIIAVDFLKDRVVSGSRDGTICICDALSGEVVLGPLKVASNMIGAVAYSANGKLIATGSYDRVDVWDAQNGSQVLGPLTELDGWVRSIQFSPDGTRIVGGSQGPGGCIVVWDVADGKNVFGSLDGHNDRVNSVSYSPDGALIASSSYDQTIMVWNAYTGKKAIGPLTGHSYLVLSVDFSPDSTRLISGSSDNTIRIWDVQTGEMMFELLHGHGGWIRSVEYSPDGTRILSWFDDMTVRIYDARSPEERAPSRSASEVGDWTMNKDGWVVDDQSRLLVWVPGDLRTALTWPSTLQVRVDPYGYGYVRLKFDITRMGDSWVHSYMSEM
ncbi:hypothetical protein OPQ81_001769 [Rhizoctonia solani]|nr:hypothetical protein OPQ81_001769 [Rhizoctonia solani]